jgi:hypothetical protein
LYYTEYRKTGAIDRVKKKPRTEEEKKVDAFNDFNNRFSRTWNLNKQQKNVEWGHRVKASVVMSSLNDIQYKSPFLYNPKEVEGFDQRVDAMTRYRADTNMLREGTVKEWTSRNMY